ncbi:hypothetical protein P3T76_010973 [Phytophthora citrophthora]|uniref:Uncharacterized protein n=1 Tax=Phytophthora citrophthora TaxID=4793 RepID=A0AAD9GBD8_9STRA|nr:hypothetical protein P3T76_010973 [Phytophthora citrophthora]
MEVSTSPGIAVSGLMQQLKSGEISKMQLFQQLAKLQSGSSPESAVPPPPPTTVASNQTLTFTSNKDCNAPPSSATADSTTAFTFSVVRGRASNAPAPVASSFSVGQTQMNPTQFTFGVSNPVHVIPSSAATSRSFMMPPVPDPSTMVSKPSARVVENDAEFLSTGVSHEKAKRFSVQEWMANKSRASASSQVSSALRLHYQQQSHVELDPSPEVAFDNDLQKSFGAGAYDSNSFRTQPLNTANSGNPDANFSREAGAKNYMYNSTGQPQLVDDNFGRIGGDRGGEQQFIDFTEQFQDELDDDHIPSSGVTNGGKGGVPGSGNKADGKFHARVTRWKSQKDAIREQMKQQLLQSELDECTFAPKINPKSTKVVAKLRGRQPSSVSNQGLSVLQAVSERLYQEADNYRIREELATKLKADEEAEIERQCTFKPKTNPTEKVKAKYMEAKATSSPSLTAASREAAAKELAECTFYPKVNGIRSEMVSAQLYLQQNIYERLSKPCCDAEDGKSPARGRSGRRKSLSLFSDDDIEDGDNLDLCSPRSCQDDISVRPGGKSRSRLSSGIRRGSGPRSVDGGDQSQEQKEERARQFKNFIERQRFHEQARHKRIELTKQQLTPGYKPTINKKSLAMMENGRKGDFLERISSYALRKEHDNVKKRTIRSADPNCTFKPAINQTSTKRKPRSITELSRGDLLRRETTQRLMKLKMEQEEMAALTFRPQLNRMSERHEGRLKILSNPDTYLQRIQQQSQAHTIKQRRALQEKEMGEFAECTFKPRTIEAPAYVQRIARSVSLTKALRAQQQAAARAKEKPEWK